MISIADSCRCVVVSRKYEESYLISGDLNEVFVQLQIIEVVPVFVLTFGNILSNCKLDHRVRPHRLVAIGRSSLQLHIFETLLEFPVDKCLEDAAILPLYDRSKRVQKDSWVPKRMPVEDCVQCVRNLVLSVLLFRSVSLGSCQYSSDTRGTVRHTVLFLCDNVHCEASQDVV